MRGKNPAVQSQEDPASSWVERRFLIGTGADPAAARRSVCQSPSRGRSTAWPDSTRGLVPTTAWTPGLSPEGVRPEPLHGHWRPNLGRHFFCRLHPDPRATARASSPRKIVAPAKAGAHPTRRSGGPRPSPGRRVNGVGATARKESSSPRRRGPTLTPDVAHIHAADAASECGPRPSPGRRVNEGCEWPSPARRNSGVTTTPPRASACTRPRPHRRSDSTCPGR